MMPDQRLPQSLAKSAGVLSLAIPDPTRKAVEELGGRQDPTH
jgi:hypothetical protein